MGLHSVSDFYTTFLRNFTRVNVASDGDVNFPE